MSKDFEEIVLQKLQNLEKYVEVLKDSVSVIENKVTTEIPALFEGYTIHQDEQKIIIERENNLELLTAEHSIRIANLEESSKEYSKKLKQLIS